MKLLLFDVDATLISTGGAGLRALNRAFKKLLDLESAMLDIAPHGKTDPAIVREVFQKRVKEKSATEDVIAEVIAMYVGISATKSNDPTTVLPGIRDILAQMRQRRRPDIWHDA
jgi:phosphoglycolate phosphatase-like HAD superfamily hydrolase